MADDNTSNDTTTDEPGRTTRRISCMKCAHSAGATWCSTQIAVTRSKPASSNGKFLPSKAR